MIFFSEYKGRQPGHFLSGLPFAMGNRALYRSRLTVMKFRFGSSFSAKKP